MNIEEARKIIADHEAGKCDECFEGECMDEAKGFIKGYEAGRREALEQKQIEEHMALADEISFRIEKIKQEGKS